VAVKRNGAQRADKLDYNRPLIWIKQHGLCAQNETEPVPDVRCTHRRRRPGDDAQAQVKGNIEAGEGKVAMCIGCHGIMDYQTNFPEVYKVPMIAGQNAKYIETVLGEYKKGTRKHPSMRGIAGSLTEQDIADVAAYYTALGEVKGAPEVPATPPAARADVAALLQRVLACLATARTSTSRSTRPTPRSPASTPTTCTPRSRPTGRHPQHLGPRQPHHGRHGQAVLQRRAEGHRLLHRLAAGRRAHGAAGAFR
jgi:cytochrome c553